MHKVAPTMATVLIHGETGTGKTLVAHALHAVGSRAGKKFVLVSCGAFEEEALAKRLFGPMNPEDSQLPACSISSGNPMCTRSPVTRNRSGC